VRVVDEFESGFGWQADEAEFLERTSHAVLSSGEVWLLDAIDVDGLDDRVRALGEPAGVIQLLDRHDRDCLTIAERLGVPLLITPRAAHPAFVSIRVVWLPVWHEVAVVFPGERVLVVGDALGTASYFRAPGERLAVNGALRLWPPRKLADFEPRHVLCGHGEGVHGDEAAAALREALATARSRIPSWFPASIRAWRSRPQ
jgi:glyoxylase-like metal-dependent hydrolase (beta-lactamase superfamily II)